MAASTRKNKAAADGSPSKHPEKPAAGVEQDSSDNESSQEDDDQTVPVQVNNACITELKNALDDTMKSYLTSKVGFTQDYFCDDVKLGLGWTSNIIAAGISLAGWHFGWEKTQGYTAYCVGAYMVLSLALTVFTSTVEKKKVFVGTKPSKASGTGPDKVTISTEVKPFDPVYQLQLEYETCKKSGPPKKYQVALKPHFKEFFDVDGILDESRWNNYLDNALKTAISKT
ncbi:hypothetical protein PGT21_025775 [Puccinia graminis f. sp. tritici]|uniref:Signal peptidase complex subunit 2 n=2 Tax=Puccinia graminis f. sp. tritici TaxID=56615 RepID=E3KTK3_PUCGT|nr:uncharacterized protein PGTG_13496 [Puccinia graminis f. sp. tritici CRL 75-36-700-3]EFP87710.1 hypothetical protein PGTG_13496 [Puccinia graminis f. sp. tritici CRL 75-36-700-3]KAA1101604.1 hypothetical protein PGT21_025775 [Puccinia graminis f. sp. tritici]KAA1136360.1 hypothetical protein PGTUg99_027584 [Puccinia graminis f. sp. tritici]